MYRDFVSSTVLLVLFLAAASSTAEAQTASTNGEQRVTITVRPAQTAEERVADSMKEKELRRVADEKSAAEEAARATASSPAALLRSARTVFVSSGTSFFEPVQLQNALMRRGEFEAWRMAIVDGREKRAAADIQVEIDRPLFTYTHTYKITARDTGILLASGKITAFDGNAAAPRLAAKIIEHIKNARGESAKR